MKYLKLFNSHEDYEEAEITEDPVVIYDGEHVHWEEYEGEPTDTTTIVE